MKTLKMKIAVPEVEGGRLISAEVKDGNIFAKFEIEDRRRENVTPLIFKGNPESRIDYTTFDGKWLEHHPTTMRQKMTLRIYQKAKSQGRLHAFTCMRLDPSIKDGKLVYQQGLPPALGFSCAEWRNMLKEYNPSRNSRLMTITEYACRNLFLIKRLVESGYEIEEAWETVCDDSQEIGHYSNSDNHSSDFEPTGSRGVCGFYDLANTWKILEGDSEIFGDFWAASGFYNNSSKICPVGDIRPQHSKGDYVDISVGMLALD